MYDVEEIIVYTNLKNYIISYSIKKNFIWII